MIEFLRQPWPWYVAGPLIGLIVPILLLIGNKQFGVSSNLRHACAACIPGKVNFFQYDWKKAGGWNLIFIGGTVLGGFIGGWLLSDPHPVNLSHQAVADLKTLGITHFTGMMPQNLFSWENLASIQGITVMVIGGFLVGFGARYAGGCTSGHAISGLADLQWASLLAVMGFFAGGLITTYLLYPLLF